MAHLSKHRTVQLVFEIPPVIPHPFSFSPPLSISFSPFLPFSLSPPLSISFSPFHPFSLSPFLPLSPSPFHPFTLSPFHPFTLSPFHPFTLSPPLSLSPSPPLSISFSHYLCPMTDVHNKETRSFNMSQIKGKNTKPEML